MDGNKRLCARLGLKRFLRPGGLESGSLLDQRANAKSTEQLGLLLFIYPRSVCLLEHMC